MRAGGLARGIVVGVASLTGACAAILGIDDRLPDEASTVVDGGPDTAPPPVDAPADDVVERTLTIDVDWPTVDPLDPLKDLRATKVRVSVKDAADPSRAAAPLAVDVANRGPYTVTLRSSARVDVVADVVTASGQILGYGERRAFDVSQRTDVPVAVRRRILYFCSTDRGAGPGQLRALGMTPPGAPEPAVDETIEALATLKLPTDLLITTDGVTLVEAGLDGSSKGALAVYATGSHVKRHEIPLAFHPAGLARLGDGTRVLAVPNKDVNADTFAIVDVETKQVTPIPAGPTGGAIDVQAVAGSPDGSRAAAVGSIPSGGGGPSAAVLFLFDASTSKVSTVDLAKLVPPLANARGVRFARDGMSVIVAGALDAQNGWFTGKLMRFALDGSVIETIDTMAAGQTNPNGLILHADGAHAYVSDETRYGGTTCCGDTWLFDIVNKTSKKIGPFGANGPEYELASALKVPYAPGYVFAGQTDNGNNVHNAIIDITDPLAPKTVPRQQNVGDIGTMNAIATPFGTPL